MNYELELENISKSFGSTKANRNINLKVMPEEIHAIVGENGAGKTTLMNILYGVIKPDSGRILLRGKPINIRNPHDAISMGIGMIHQHFMLVPSLTVAENIVLGMPPKGKFIWRQSDLEDEIKELLDEIGLPLPLSAKVRDLSVGLMQRVEIVKVLYRGARIIIMDEPTATLTPIEVNELFHVIQMLKQQGHTIIFITHKLKEVKEISDRVTALRDGQVTGEAITKDTTPHMIAKMMIGRDLSSLNKSKCNRGDSLLEISNISIEDDYGSTIVKNLSFNVSSGEILGIAGVEGNGQTELSEAILGVRKAADGSIFINKSNVTKRSPKDRMNSGLGFIPQDRMREGLALSLRVIENLIAGSHTSKPIKHGIFLDWKNAEKISKKLAERFSIKTPSVNEVTHNLSGGNLQKVVVAREISRDPILVVACQPTRGLDIGSTRYIRSILLEIRNNGGAVLLISADLDEILELSDRIIVLYEGANVGELQAKDASEEKLGPLMFGLSTEGSTMKSKLKLNHSKIKNSLFSVRRVLIILLLAFALNAIVLLLTEKDVFLVYKTLFTYSFVGKWSIAKTIRWVTPLLFTGLAAATAFRGGVFNIGLEGQVLIGAIAAAWCGINLDFLPRYLLIPSCMLGAMIAGGIYSSIAGFLNVKFKANIVVITLMMNYIASLLTEYLVMYPMYTRIAGEARATENIAEHAQLSVLIEGSQVTTAIFIGLILVIIVYLWNQRSIVGYEVQLVGQNPKFAEFIGIDVPQRQMLLMFVSGAIAGLCGGLEIIGVHRRFVINFGSGLGFNGMVVAVLAENNPLLVPFGAIFFGALQSGSAAVDMFADVPRSIVSILTGIIIMTITIKKMPVQFTQLKLSIKGIVSNLRK